MLQFNLSLDEKISAYNSSAKYTWKLYKVPPVYTGNWSAEDWIKYIDNNGAWFPTDYLGKREQFLNDTELTRVNNDINGNPRYVVHFLSCEPETWKDYENTLTNRYKNVCKLMNKIGGRKFHNKQYGGGIVFQSYNVHELIYSIFDLKYKIDNNI